jgi:hypothetical protein
MSEKYLNSNTLAGSQFSDEEVAGFVRMLMRQQVNHEAICTMGRDRIMLLSERLQRADEIIQKLMTVGFDNLLPESVQEIETHMAQSKSHPKGNTGNKPLYGNITFNEMFRTQPFTPSSKSKHF